MTPYEPELGDVVDVSCQPYCGAQLSLHAISPLLRGKRGVIEDIEAPNAADHIYRVRFYGPEWAKVEVKRGQGVRMYFKLSELQKVDRDVDTKVVK